jgi:hypothetical protein
MVHDLEEMISNGKLTLNRNSNGIKKEYARNIINARDKGVKNHYYTGCELIKIQDFELVKAFESVSKDKAVRWDLIPGKPFTA